MHKFCACFFSFGEDDVILHDGLFLTASLILQCSALLSHEVPLTNSPQLYQVADFGYYYRIGNHQPGVEGCLRTGQ